MKIDIERAIGALTSLGYECPEIEALRADAERYLEYTKLLFCLAVGALNERWDAPEDLVEKASALLDQIPDSEHNTIEILHEIYEAIDKAMGK